MGAAVALVLAACGGEPPADPPGGGPVAEGTVAFEDRARFDLTDDGRPESFRVRARGPSWEALDVVLEIRAPDGERLLRDGWPSFTYFQYDPLGGKADSTVRRIVLGHLRAVLADSAFLESVEEVDERALAFDLARVRWRAEHGLSDTAALPRRAYPEVRETEVSDARTERIREELLGRPGFHWYAGGESRQTVAWSPSVGRLLLTYTCC